MLTDITRTHNKSIFAVAITLSWDGLLLVHISRPHAPPSRFHDYVRNSTTI
jgi:hypothetical protein